MSGAREKTEGDEPSDVLVELVDERGASIGVTLRLDPERTGDVAGRVRGWSRLVVDGSVYTFSKERAAQLLARFPHFAEQAEKAGKAR